VIVGPTYIERVSAFETKYDAVLVVHAHGVKTSKVTGERVQSIPGRHPQFVEPGHRVDLIQFPVHARPQFVRNAPGRLAVDAVPDVPGSVIGQRPDHRIAL